jgi:hypothetical protein
MKVLKDVGEANEIRKHLCLKNYWEISMMIKSKIVVMCGWLLY